jgi:hypothetical protein
MTSAAFEHGGESGLKWRLSQLTSAGLMIEDYPNRQSAAPVAEADPYEARRAELHRMPARARIPAIESDLKEVARLPTTAATFHRKKLLRMHDAARLEAKQVTPAQLQKENSFSSLDFSTAQLVFQPRPRQRA